MPAGARPGAGLEAKEESQRCSRPASIPKFARENRIIALDTPPTPPLSPMPNFSSNRILPILALALLGAGCILVLWPFLTALVWAAILASTSWPAFLWLDRAVGGRRLLAASLMTLLVTVVLLCLLYTSDAADE